MKSKMFLLLLALFVLATPIFAQEPPVQLRRSGDHHHLGYRDGPRFRPLRACVRVAPSAPPPKRSLAIPELATSFAAR